MILPIGIHEAISVHGNVLLGVSQCGCSFRVSSESGEALKQKKNHGSVLFVIFNMFQSKHGRLKQDLHN